MILFLMTVSSAMTIKNCLLLKNQKCKVRKGIADNDSMTFPYKIKVDRCLGSCNDVENPYFKVCLPDIVKNISVKVFDLVSQQNKFKNINFHESCKCGCLLDEKVCNNKQKWNKNKCKCECLIEEKCSGNSFFYGINCSFEMKKAAALISTEECDVETDESIGNKTVTLIKKSRRM